MRRTITSEKVDHENEARSISTDDFTLSLLERSESFICGFEGDEDQDGIDELLRDLRTAIAQLQARAKSAHGVTSSSTTPA